ncbi:AAA family ATPase [Bacillus wiedmannii]|uniref:hypothetical protein n=1 Tax=Bacillus wiedmannii TaxID=1890302 RepID=UPI0035262081
MRINKIIIKNFRNYIGEHVFDLSKNVTILYGDNGFGKSSFFDALEWCLTDKIGRFQNEDVDSFKKDLLNKSVHFEEECECSVKIEYGDYILTRKFTSKNGNVGRVNANVSDKNGNIIRNSQNEKINTKDRVDDFLKGGIEYNKSIPKGAFGEVMKQAYILSQDQVTDFVGNDDPGKRYRALVDIMGYRQLLNLSDNSRKVLSKLENNLKKLDAEIVNHQQAIKNKNETKQEVDLITLNEELNSLGIKIEEEEYQQQLDKILENKFADKKDAETLLISYKRLLDDYEFGCLNDLEKKRQVLQEDSIQLTDKISKLKKIKIDAENKKADLERLKRNFKTLNNSDNKIKDILEQLKKLNVLSYDKEFLNKLLVEQKTILAKYEYALAIHEDYHEQKRNIIKIPEQLDIYKATIKVLNKKYDKRKEISINLENLLLDNDTGAVVTLVESIRGIYEYLQKEEPNTEYCPVCSSHAGASLSEEIINNIHKYNNSLSEQSGYVKKVLALKESVSKNIKELKKKEEFYNNSIESQKRKYSRAKERIVEIETHKYFDELTCSKDINKVTELYNFKSDYIKSLQDAFNKLIELDQLYNQIKNLNNVLNHSSYEETVHSIYLLDKAHKRIVEYIKKVEAQIKNVRSNKEILDKEQELISNINQYRDSTAPITQLIESTHLNISNTEKDIEKINKVKEWLISIKNNSKIEEQVLKIKQDRKVINSERSSINKVALQLKEHIESTYGEFGQQTMEYFNKPDSPIQKYFRYLNPLPTKNSIQFEGENEEVWVKVVQEGEQKCTNNAQNVLSSGQLNVLAISIFIAMNEEQKLHNMDFIGIDDPIQNMDDVNQFSICDVLSSIEKQLIISTHDLNFLKLFLKKNEHRKKEIQIFNFKSPILTKNKVNVITLD